MDTREKLLKLRNETWNNAAECIMPFWRDYTVDHEYGGFYGSVNKDLKPVEGDVKSLVLNTRMLWGFTNAYDLLGDEKYADNARRSFDYILEHFWDKEYGGVYYMISHDGKPLSCDKRMYGQACFLYAAAEFYYVFKDQRALDYIHETLRLMDTYTMSPLGAYRDYSNRRWDHDLWLDAPYTRRLDGSYSLNCHLHMFESLTLIYKSTKDPAMGKRMRDMLLLILDHMIEYDRGHLKAAMDADCNRTDNEINFGHDLECAYLMMDAAEMLGEPELIKRVQDVVVTFANKAVEEGMDPIDGAMNAEMNLATGESDRAKIWWVECESISGILCAYEICRDEKLLDAVISIWEYVKKHMLCEDGIEWYGLGTHEDDFGPNQTEIWWTELFGGITNKSNRIKCPYHNSRAMFGAAQRIDRILGA